MPRKDKVLVANGQGFWGDSLLGPIMPDRNRKEFARVPGLRWEEW